MGLSLEIKKFINGEHTGDYVSIYLPVQAEEAQPARAKKPIFRAGADADVPYTPQSEPVEPKFELTRMHYIEDGVGEPLLLVHSLGQSCYTWRNVFFRLREHYRVIAVDLPGHGYSDRPVHFGYGVEDHAFALQLFMDAMGLQSAHIAAFSMGSAYALQLALNAPERIGRMLLIAPGGVSADMPLPVKLIDSAFFGPVASMLYGMGTVRKVLEDCFFDLTNINDEVIQQYYRPASDPDGRRCIRYSLQAFDDSRVVARLRELEVPILILHGNEDKWHKPADVEIYQTALRNTGVAVIRNAGHLMHEEKADRFVAAALEFIPVLTPEGEG